MPEFHSMEYAQSMTKNAKLAETYSWSDFFKKLGADAVVEPVLIDPKLAVPVSVFRSAPLREYIEHINDARDNMVFFVETKDFKKNIDPRMKTVWLAKVRKIVGYRALMRWVGADPETDTEQDFWASLGSADVNGVSIFPEDDSAFCIPPRFLEINWRRDGVFQENLTKALTEAQVYKTVNADFSEARLSINADCRLKEGQRLELLDYAISSRIRPARVKAVCGRRVNVQVLKLDCEDFEEDDRQYGPEAEFWVDQSSFFLFPVGWATYNGYKLTAKEDYKRHASRIAQALTNGAEPQYGAIDVRPEQLNEWRKVPDNPAQQWEKGMKLEFMDPLGSSFRDLYVATVMGVLYDGFLKIGIDGPDMEEDAIPIHCTSPLLFPAGYAKQHGLKLVSPDNFSWETATKRGVKTAPAQFFKPDPTPERIAQFPIGAKLEANDMLENLIICPATVTDFKGRLIALNFDGWGSEFDQYFDVDSCDLFPLGWCEVHGFKLQNPKGYVEDDEMAKKKAKK